MRRHVAVEEEFEKARAEVEARYQADLMEYEQLGTSDFRVLDSLRRTGSPVLTPIEANADRDRLIEKAEDKRRFAHAALDVDAHLAVVKSRRSNDSAFTHAPERASFDSESFADQVVKAIDRHTRDRPSKYGPRVTAVPREVRSKLAELRISGASVAEIIRQTGLGTRVVRRLVKEIDGVVELVRLDRASDQPVA
jgi:hypothetical protein